MNLAGQPAVLAKISWQDPQSGEMKDFFLPEGGTTGIGRLEDNHISIREQHVSRQHAVIDYRDGVFVITISAALTASTSTTSASPNPTR